jgi:alpha-L-fucosidase
MAYHEKIQEFLERRFGMFIHFGVYSALAGEWNGKTVEDDIGEWIMNSLQIPIAEYEKIASGFKPEKFDADRVAALAKKAGMRYLVITSKHHDGFAMFRSQCDKYNIHDWDGFGRDVVGELAEACRKQNIKFGLYYSQSLDWHEEHAGGWEVKPGKRPSWGNVWDYPDNSRKDFSIYFEKKVKPQVKEILSNYGDIFLLWFDTPKTITPGQSEELYRLVKNLQPDCLVNSRIGNGKGDYGSLGDNQIPEIPMEDPYESPVTLNDTWGYKHYDNNWKTSEEIIEMLAKLSSRNVNLLLNIGPKGDGTIPEETEKILEGVSSWINLNGKAVRRASGSPVPGGLDWGYMTSSENRLFMILRESEARTVEVNGLETTVSRVYFESSGEDVPFAQIKGMEDEPSALKINLPGNNLYMPVVTVECVEKPVFKDSLQVQNKTLYLSPVTAKLFDGRLKYGKSSRAADRYLTYEHLGKLHLDIGGVLKGWSGIGEYLEWDAEFTRTGVYSAEVIIAARHLTADVLNAAEVEVLISGESALKSNLREDYSYSESRSSAYNNRRIATACGNLKVDKPGIHSVKLKLKNDLSGKEAEIPLVALRFVHSGD